MHPTGMHPCFITKYKNLFELSMAVRFPALLTLGVVRVERYLHGALPAVVLLLSQKYLRPLPFICPAFVASNLLQNVMFKINR